MVNTHRNVTRKTFLGESINSSSLLFIANSWVELNQSNLRVRLPKSVTTLAMYTPKKPAESRTNKNKTVPTT